jgi:hypothetical protein
VPIFIEYLFHKYIRYEINNLITPFMKYNFMNQPYKSIVLFNLIIKNMTLSALDDLDRRILEQLQQDASLTNHALAERVHASPPTCLRRVKRLNALGVIAKQVAILDPDSHCRSNPRRSICRASAAV